MRQHQQDAQVGPHTSSERVDKQMTPEDFVSCVHKDVVLVNVTTYRELFKRTPPQAATDPHWKRALTLYGSLSDAEREVLFAIIRQVTVDAVSSVLGILDGSSATSAGPVDLALQSVPDGRTLNGDLQSEFLRLDESSRAR